MRSVPTLYGSGYFKSIYYNIEEWKKKRTLPSDEALGTAVSKAFETGFFQPKIFPNVITRTNLLAIKATDSSSSRVSENFAATALATSDSPVPSSNATLTSVGLAAPVRNILAKIDPEVVTQRIRSGERLNIYRNMYGDFNYNFIPEPEQARPRLYLVEIYRLSSFLGDYGAGRTLKTFSLLPGEKTKISIKTYTKTTTDFKNASSILDSFTEESAQSFEEDIRNEESDKRNEAESDEYYVDAEASGGFNVLLAKGDFKVRGGYKGSSNSAREQLTKKVTNATQKNSSRASAKRDVQVNTSYEVQSVSGEELSTERQIENINVSRTLNFVFRQMNQEFISLFHLVDVRIGFSNGFGESKREVPLYELDSLLNEVMVDDNEKRQNIRQLIIGELQNVFDYEDKPQNLVEEQQLIAPPGQPPLSYLRLKKIVSTYRGDTDDEGIEIKVPGIILAANKYTMRTDGVIVEALLGQAEALDNYSKGLQEEAVEAKQIANRLAVAQLEREKLAQKIVKEKDAEAAEIFSQVFPPPVIINDGAND
ncbi:hypothetical protein [Chlorogloeopsis sp. ULAP02]|uniref:hypothetical protein n=1 Tax=Chlorogloeopsis sp. ULAP02 TaxID=3107926 RepID=UPI003136B655